MSSELSISTILQIAQVCEYVAIVNNARNNTLQGGNINPNLGRLIYIERTAVQNRYNLNPSDPTLRGTANYLYSILWYQSLARTIIANLAGNPPVITGPTPQSVNVGATATFSVSVTGTAPFTYQWLLGGVPIAGATNSSLILTNAQLSQSGGLYSVEVTNPVTTITSNQAVLTVTASITGFLYYSSSDPGPTLLSNSDPFTYQISYSITHNQPVSIPLTSAAANNQFLVAKIPSTESDKTIWFSTVLNNGTIPDFVFAPMLTFGGFDYYYTKQLGSYDATQPLVLS